MSTPNKAPIAHGSFWHTAYRTARGGFRHAYPRLVIDQTPLDKTVFVAGAGRSGTTWLADLINYRKDHRLLFEPFNLTKRFRDSPLCCGHKHGDENRWYTRSNDDCPERLKVASTIIRGVTYDPGPDALNRRPLYRRRLVKEIVCLLYLDWLARRIPDVKYVLIVRNPYAVAESQARYDWGRAAASDYLACPELIADHLAGQVSRLQEYDEASPFERAVLAWAIKFRVLMRQEIGKRVRIVHYERLLRSESELHRLFRQLGRDDAGNALKQAEIPSATTWRPTTSDTSRLALVPNMTREKRLRADAILDLFELGDVYSSAGDLLHDNWLGQCPDDFTCGKPARDMEEKAAETRETSEYHLTNRCRSR